MTLPTAIDVDIENKIKHNIAAHNRMAVFFGGLAGLVFALVAWGIDSYQLAQAHSAVPFLQFILGLVPCLLTGMLAGWLSYHFNNLIISLLAWLAAGWIFARLGGHMSFEITTAALRVLEPTLAAQVNYPFNDAARAYQGIILITTMGVSAVAAFLAVMLIENAVETSAPLARLIPIILWMVLFSIAGLSVQDNLTRRLTVPIQRTDELIQFALQHEGQPVDKKLASQMHLRSIEPFQNLLHRPRRIILLTFDQTFSDLTVRVNFDGQAIDCFIFADAVNICKPSQ